MMQRIGWYDEWAAPKKVRDFVKQKINESKLEKILATRVEKIEPEVKDA